MPSFFLAATAVALFAGRPTAAPRSGAPVLAVETTAAEDSITQHRFHLPAAPLRRALDDFARQAAISVRLDAPLGDTTRSSAVAGNFTPNEALDRLLAGTGFVGRFVDPQSVVVSRPGDRESQHLGAVLVRGDRRVGYTAYRSSAAMRGDVALRDVPQAVTVIGSQLVADQAMQGMADVVRYVPGVTMGQGEGHRDAPTIRGNASTADFFVDGVRDDAQYLRDLYNVERVEAIKGANAMVFGRGGGGGVINRVTKDARWQPVFAASAAGGSHDHKRTTLDVGDGAGPVAGRVTGMYERSGSFRDRTALERQGINPTAALLAGGTLLRLGYEHFADRRTVDRGIPAFSGGPSRADVTTFFGDPDNSRSRFTLHSVAMTVERGSEEGLLLRNRARWTSYDKYYSNVFPGGAVSVSGTDTTVRLSAYTSATDRRNLFNQTDVSYAFAAGGVRQTMLAGVEVGRQATENLRESGFFGDTTEALTVPFGRPTVSADIVFRQKASDADNRSVARVSALYVQHRVELGRHVQLVGGVRWDRFSVDFANHRDTTQLSRTDRLVSPRAGLVIKPAEPLSFYGTWSVSHLPGSGDQFASLTATTAALEPERFTNLEAGFKWDLSSGLSVAGAVYRLDRTNTSAPDPVIPSRTVQTGEQRTTGWELTASGNVTTRWQLAGGVGSHHAKITSRTAAAREGATVPLVPRHTLSLWNRFQLTPRYGVGFGAINQAKMYAAVDNAVTLPAFTRYDAAAFAMLTPFLRAQLNIENLTNRTYYPTSHGNNNILPGATRTVRLSFTATR